MEGKMIKKRDWDEFRATGLLFFINQILHVFGWAIVFEIEKNKVKSVYPARTSFRGFGDTVVSDGYKQVNKYMSENADELYKEIEP